MKRKKIDPEMDIFDKLKLQYLSPEGRVEDLTSL